MSKRKTEAEKSGAFEIYEQIREYCVERIEGIGGHYGQGSYKVDFFNIFVAGYTNGLCGMAARQIYKKRTKQLKRKRIDFSDYSIYGDSIRNYLAETCLTDNTKNRENQRMVITLCKWWDAWTYAWDRFPARLPRKWKLYVGHPLDNERLLVSEVISNPSSE